MLDQDLQELVATDERTQQLRNAIRAEAQQTGASADAVLAQFDGRARAGSASWGEVPTATAARSYGRELWYVSPEQRRRELEGLRGRADAATETVPPASILFEVDTGGGLVHK